MTGWLLLLVLSVMLVPLIPAQADVIPQVEVVIETMSTPVLDVSDPDQVVTLSGTVTNRSSEGLRSVVVHFWR